VEIVEAEDKESAIYSSSFGELCGLYIYANECADDMPLGECDLADIVYNSE